MTEKGTDRYCKARTKNGKRCKAAATAGGLCFFHANPSKAVELGRIGGKSKGRAVAEAIDPLPRLDTAIAVRDTVARLVADLFSGKLQPKIVSGLASLLSLQLRAIETSALELRIAKLEKLLAETGYEEFLDAKGKAAAMDVGTLPTHNFDSQQPSVSAAKKNNAL